jgi:hypothetical protein
MDLKDYYGYLLLALIMIIIIDNLIELFRAKNETENRIIKPIASSNIVVGCCFLMISVIIYVLNYKAESSE